MNWRTTAVARLAGESFDVLVVGAGATGAAVARDAALRGLRVALCDWGDFGGQTSSQSSKLIHGGLRYLERADLHLVFEALAERGRLLRAAPHLGRPVEFLYPAYRGCWPPRALLGLGVALYGALALWRPPAGHRRLSATDVYRLSPWLRAAGLAGAETYLDCQTDDARLVLENVLDAESQGAVAASYVEVPTLRSGRQSGFRVFPAVDRDTGAGFSVRARAAVNATGPFTDWMSDGPAAVRPTLGVHVVLDAARLPTGGRATVIRSPRDRRLMFVLPAGRRTIVGTTDTDWTPPASARAPHPAHDIRARAEDVDYLVEAAAHAFPPAGLSPADVISTFAGLRPLVAGGTASPSATSREHDVRLDAAGVVTVTGGKLTTMRRMAEDAVDAVCDVLRARGHDSAIGPCVTRTRPLPGGAGTGAAGATLAPDVRERLLGAYGARAAQVASLAESAPALARRLVPDLPYATAEIVFAARHERACEVEDVLRRRVPLFRDAPDQGLAAATEVADVLAAELGWSPARRSRSLEDYRAAVDRSRRWQTE